MNNSVGTWQNPSVALPQSNGTVLVWVAYPDIDGSTYETYEEAIFNFARQTWQKLNGEDLKFPVLAWSYVYRPTFLG